MNKVMIVLALWTTLQTASAQWRQYNALWEGKPGSMLYNDALRDTSLRDRLPYHVTIGWRYANCSDQGLPDALTHEALTTLSDKLSAYLDIQSTCTLVGTLVHDCHWYDYYYLRDTIALSGFIQQYFSQNASDFTPIVSMVYDSAWTFYDRKIYPDLYLQEYELNRNSMNELPASIIGATQRLDHWAYFADVDARDRYRIVVLEQGFKEESKGELKDGKALPHFYHFSRRDKLDAEHLTELTVRLSRQAKKLNGTYEGWSINE